MGDMFNSRFMSENDLLALTQPTYGIGKKFYLVPAKGSNAFYDQLRSFGVADGSIFITPSSAYNAMKSGRGDALYVYPGDYITTTKLTWAKNDTFVFGLSNNVEGDYTQGGCNIYTITASVAQTLYVTGARCHFENLKLSNGGANAANLGAVLLAGYGATFKNVNMMGILDTAQIASANPYSLGIAYGAYFPRFEDCIIGQCTWGPRTQTASGHLKFTGAALGTYPPDGGVFRNCRFLSWGETVTLAMVYISATGQSLDRMWLFDNCTFYNFYTSSATGMNQVFDDQQANTHHIVLKKCTAVGYDEWQDADSALKMITADMPITGLGGGLCRPPTAVTGS